MAIWHSCPGGSPSSLEGEAPGLTADVLLGLSGIHDTDGTLRR